MKSKTMIPAFSIIETILGMVVTAIIIGILFVIFSIVTERMIDYKNQNTQICDLNRLTYSINKDIFENEKMNSIANELIFEGYSGENVKYFFLEDCILRDNRAFIDTFRIKLKRIHIDTLKSKTEQLVFQKIKMNVNVNESETDLKFYKRIYANVLLKKLNKK